MSTNLTVLAGAGGLMTLLAAGLVARRLMRAGYPWAEALAVEAVALIGGIGAVQSYMALRWLLLWGDLTEWLADVAPATVDLFGPVMGLVALSARRRGEPDRYADNLALGYSIAAVLANLAAAGFDVSAHGYEGARVAVVLLAHTAPVTTFLLGAHYLMRRAAGPTARKATERERSEHAAAPAPVVTLASARPERGELPPATDGGPAETAELRAQVRADLAQRVARRARAESARSTAPNGRAKTAPRRAPNGSRADQVRALLAEPDGSALTGDEIGARLGIDPGYARRLRSEVEREDDPGRRPRVLEVAAAPAAAAEEA